MHKPKSENELSPVLRFLIQNVKLRRDKRMNNKDIAPSSYGVLKAQNLITMLGSMTFASITRVFTYEYNTYLLTHVSTSYLCINKTLFRIAALIYFATAKIHTLIMYVK